MQGAVRLIIPGEIKLNGSISIDRAEVLRYLGYMGQEIDAELSALIDENIKNAEIYPGQDTAGKSAA